MNHAIGLEEQKAIAAGDDPSAEPGIVSRAVQSTTGLATGIVAFGPAAGGTGRASRWISTAPAPPGPGRSCPITAAPISGR